MTQLNILFDAKSSQVQVDTETGTRLTDLYGTITSPEYGWNYEVSTVEPLTLEYMMDFDVVCILTRLMQTAPPQAFAPLHPPGTKPKKKKALPLYPVGTKPGPYVNPFPVGTNFQYTPDELDAFQEFVAKKGDNGGVLLISDHGPFQDNPTDNQTINDCQLAAAFGVQIQPACFESPSGDMLVMSADCLNPNPSDSPMYDAIEQILEDVSEIQVHNSCAIFPMQNFPNVNAAPIANLPSDVCNNSPINSMSSDGCAYAWLVEFNGGNVIIAGNSGLSGNPDSPYPAPGLFTGDNVTFLMNCLEWLGTPED